MLMTSSRGKRGFAAPAALAAGLILAASAGTKAQATPFIYRGIVLPYGDAAVDMGLGIGRAPVSPGSD
ncbi:MAG: hypothetical protein QOI66_1494, partial [Myxococcales bacterium]|nr:hypothetical protein [Myxococcales bacterium]